MGVASTRVRESVDEGTAARFAFEQARLPGVFAFPITVIDVDLLRWVHSPFEIAASFGARISAGHERVRVIGYTNGYGGYLADEEISKNGDFEAQSSFFDQDETHRIVDVITVAAQ